MTARNAPHAAIVDGGGVECDPDAADAERISCEESAVLVWLDLATDARILKDVLRLNDAWLAEAHHLRQKRLDNLRVREALKRRMQVMNSVADFVVGLFKRHDQLFLLVVSIFLKKSFHLPRRLIVMRLGQFLDFSYGLIILPDQTLVLKSHLFTLAELLNDIFHLVL